MNAVASPMNVHAADQRWRANRRGCGFSGLILVGLFCVGLASDGWSEDREARAAARGHAARHAAAIERAEGLANTERGRISAAIQAQLGDALLRGGQVEASIAAFERAIQLRPDQRPYLWQYGIALFFAGRHQEGQQLFEAHRKVNPNDVENAAWHFLCVSKASDVAEARRLVLPAPADPRVPMQQVLQRLPGGNDQEIKAAVEAVPPERGRDQARFYGDLYIGLIADAEGRLPAASAALRRAAKTAATHYMADIARLYAEHLQRLHDAP